MITHMFSTYVTFNNEFFLIFLGGLIIQKNEQIKIFLGALKFNLTRESQIWMSIRIIRRWFKHIFS